MVRKFKTFFRLPWSTKLLFAEVLLTSAWVKASLCFFPVKQVIGWLGTTHEESEQTPDEQTILIRKEIKAALKLCNKYALWPTECYTLALTGKILLKKRNLSSTLYIGFKKDPKGKFKGHAWLRSHDTYISGYRESQGFNRDFIFS